MENFRCISQNSGLQLFLTSKGIDTLYMICECPRLKWSQWKSFLSFLLSYYFKSSFFLSSGRLMVTLNGQNGILSQNSPQKVRYSIYTDLSFWEITDDLHNMQVSIETLKQISELKAPVFIARLKLNID